MSAGNSTDVTRSPPGQHSATIDAFCAPDMFRGSIAIPEHPLKAETVWRRNFKYDPGAHGPESHAAATMGIPKRTLVSGVIH